MNKKLITLAVAAAMAAPAVAMAEATIYGKIHVSLDYIDIDDYANYSQNNSIGGGLYLPSGHSGGSPVAAAAAWTNTLANGYVAPDGTRITQGIPVYAYEFNRVRTAQIANGIPAAIATTNATQAAIAEALRYGTPDQLQVALAQGAYQGRAGAQNTGGYNGWDVTSVPGASRFGIKGSEDLGNGLKAIYQLEFAVDGGGQFARLQNTMRNSYVGLQGGFGTALIGRHDTPLKSSTGKLDLFADSMADYNYTVGFQDIRADNVVAYVSPNFSGFSFAGAIVAPGGEDRYNDIRNFGIPVDNNADGIAEAWSVSAKYENGPFYASIAYESLSSKLFSADYDAGVALWTRPGVPGVDWTPTVGVNTAGYQGLYGRTAQDDNKWRIGLGLLDWNGFSLTGIYEDRSNVLGAPDNSDAQLWQIQAAYAFGNNTIKGMYGQADLEGCADPTNVGFRYTCNFGAQLLSNKDKETWAIGFDHNFSKRTSAYALYTALNDDIENADWSGFSLGMIHKF